MCRSQSAKAILSLILGIGLAVPAAFGQEPLDCSPNTCWYAAPCANPPCGDGSFENPWDLQTALKPPPGTVQAGDTIWLRGGVYTPDPDHAAQACPGGNFCCELPGVDGQPVVVRQYPGERAVIDGGVRLGRLGIVHIASGYTWFWGFEIMSSASDHESVCTTCTEPPYCSSLPDDIEPAMAFSVDTGKTVAGLKFINLVIHDTATPFNLFQSSEGAEVYGCIIYYNGWHTVCQGGAGERGHGHGIYMRNPTTTPKKAIDNIVFSQFGSGIVCYDTTAPSLSNLHVEGNIVFNNGVIARFFSPPYGYQDNILIGDSADVVDPQVLNNYTYFTPAVPPEWEGLPGGRSRLGYEGTSVNALVRGNYFVTQTGVAMQFAGTNATIENNLFYGSTLDPNGVETLQYWRDHPELGNLFYNPPPGAPAGVAAFVRPSLYEAGRGNIAVYDWELAPSVPVDVSSVLGQGDIYEVRDVQNYFGVPVTAGIYLGGTINIPMPDENAAVTPPVSTDPGEVPKHTPRQFGAFVIIRTGSFPHENGPLPE